MFKEYVSHNDLTITIIDTDFQEYIGKAHLYQGTATAIILCYKRRNLDIAFNFVRYLKFLNKSIKSLPIIKLQIEFHKTQNPSLFKEFEKDLNKYLVLM